jgi:para-nitrobenzyl esterase
MGGLKSPIEDGYFLHTSIMDIYQHGKQNDVPLLMGWNKEDIVAGPPVSAANYISQINKQYGDQASQLLSVYPATNDQVAAKSQKELSRDQTFALQQFYWANIQLHNGKSPVYIYNFNRQLPGYTPATEYGAFHTAEVAFAYDNLKFVDRPFTVVDHQLATRMSNYWANFIKTGNPNGKELTKWNKYNAKGSWVMILDENSGNQELPNKKQLETLLQLDK